MWSQSVLTNIGGRKINQDYCGYYQTRECGIWVVADGMGGHFGGEVASTLAVQSILEAYKLHNEVTEENALALINIANSQIRSGQKEIPYCHNMQTTLVFVLSNVDSTIIANVGDSRCYLVSEGKLILKTKDHSLSQLLVDQGEILYKEIRFHEDRNKVLRSLGKSDTVVPSIINTENSLCPGDAFLLCTDGFWELITEEEMIIDLAKSKTPKDWIKSLENRMMYRMKPNHDNYSAIGIFHE